MPSNGALHPFGYPFTIVQDENFVGQRYDHCILCSTSRNGEAVPC